MANGDIALFVWDGDRAYWMGNTETPKALWQTDKYTFEEVPEPVAAWAEKELLAQLREEEPFLADFPTLSWFFLPVFLSKDGRDTTRAFFRDLAAGFPDADPAEATGFYEEFLSTGVFDGERYTMAAKLGTSDSLDRTRMAATMAEFNVAKLLTDAGYSVTPEIPVTTGHSIDFRADPPGALIEVTRPLPPNRRSAGTPRAAIKDTAETKSKGQLADHGGGVTLFVDCTSFSNENWARLAEEQPDVRHRPAVVFRYRPNGEVAGYTKGSVPVDLGL